MTSLQISSPINCRPGSFNSVSTSSPARLLWSEVHKYFFSFVNCLLCWQCRNNVLSFFSLLAISEKYLMVHLSKGQRIIYEGENIANVNDRECSLNTETWIVANIARKLFSKQTQLTKMATKPLRFWWAKQPGQPSSPISLQFFRSVLTPFVRKLK